MDGLRSRSYAYGESGMQMDPYRRGREVPAVPQKGKSSSSSGWGGLRDPEFQRKKRVASYKMYTVEGKVKGSMRKSFRWLKDRYTQVLYGWW